MAGYLVPKALNWQGGPIPWPARCPDLTPVDFYVWGHMKSLVYATPIPSVEILREKIIEAAEEIRRSLTSRVTVSEIRKRVRACIHRRGGHFEQDL